MMNHKPIALRIRHRPGRNPDQNNQPFHEHSPRQRNIMSAMIMIINIFHGRMISHWPIFVTSGVASRTNT